MNPRTSNWLKLACITLIPLFLFVGCAKRDAQKALDMAQESKNAAQSALAPRYTPDQYQDANRLLSTAQSQFDGGDYKQSVESAQQAQQRFLAAQNAVPAVKERVDAKLQEIDDDLAKAEANVEEARSQGALTAEEINKVASKVEDLRSRRDGEIANEIAEDALQSFHDEITAVLPQTEALAKAHLKPQADEASQHVADLMQEAQELNAATHAPDKWTQVNDLYNQIQAAQRNMQWQQVIDLAGQIETPLQDAITAAQSAAAGDILRDTERSITEASQLNIQGVAGYKESLDQARTALETGRQLLDQQNYSGAIAAADEAKNLVQQAYQTLGQEADKLIASAEDNLNQALQLDAETYAPAIVSQVRDAVARARELKDAQRFAEAYTSAQKAAQVSADAPEAAKRGKAMKAFRQVEGPFTVLKNQGGDKYAGDAYDQALQTVQGLRAKMEAGQYKDVEDNSPAAVEVVQTALNALANATQKKIDAAGEALASAEKSGAPQWTASQYANAQNLKKSAQNELEQERYLGSIQKSEQAIQAAQQAENMAYQLQADQNLRKARELISEAGRASQDDLSPNAYRTAQYTVDGANDQLKEGAYEKAYNSSVEAVAKADRALNNMVMTAKESVDSLVDAQGMTYQEEQTKKAAALLNDAQAAQNARQYPLANQKSREAIDIARQAEHLTWQERSAKLLARLEGVDAKLSADMAPQKTPDLYRSVLDNLTQAKVDQIDEDFAASYQHADAARSAMDQAYETMHSDLVSVKTDAEKKAEWIGQNTQVDDARELKMDLMDEIAELDRLIKLENWSKAFAAADKTAAEADRAIAKAQTINRKVYAAELTETYKPLTRQNALAITPDQKDTIEGAIESLKNPEKGQSYDDLVKQYEQAKDLNASMPDEIRKQAEQRTEEIASILREAEDAGARKYFPDDFRDLASDLQWLRNSKEGEDYREMSTRLTRLEKDAPKMLQATMLAVDEDNYLKSLDDLLGQMNNMLLDFQPVTDMGPDLLVWSKSTEYKLDKASQDMYKKLQSKMTSKSLRINAEILLERVKDMDPPETLTGIHKKAIESFTHFLRAAEGFEYFGDSEAYELKYRESQVYEAFRHLKKTRDINAKLAFSIQSARKLTKVEKLMRNIDMAQKDFADFYYNYDVR
ncbi:MAG: hypothetical protein GC154_21130 [bacterium]|nr:hypothetical protein [bacterium]